MVQQLTVGILAALAGSAAAHIHILDPVPITAVENPNSGYNVDYDINNPLVTMADYPCKNALQYLDGPEGTSVATYAPGSTYTMVMGTGADHEGGSCQISLSYDAGSTFTVIKSIIGGCAKQSGTWDFTIPSDAPTGEAVFSWSWNNRVGNREFYQDCSAVTIGSNGTAAAEVPVKAKRQEVAFADRPQIFVSNLGNGWCTAEGIDVMYPEPGPDVENVSSSTGAPTQC